MPSLSDIVAKSEPMNIGGVEFTCHHLGIEDLGVLLGRFPGLAAALSRRENTSLSAADILRDGKGAAFALIAAAIGKAGDSVEEEAAASLPAEYQLRILTTVIKLSFPGGLVPFIEEFTRMLGIRAPAASGRELDTTSPSQLSSSSPGVTRQRR